MCTVLLPPGGYPISVNKHSEKLKVLQLVKKFPKFYGTWVFITVLTTFCNLSIIWAGLTQSTPACYISLSFFFHLILTSAPRSTTWTLSCRFPTKTLSPLSPIRATFPTHPMLLVMIARIIFIDGYISWNSSLRIFLQTPARNFDGQERRCRS